MFSFMKRIDKALFSQVEIPWISADQLEVQAEKRDKWSLSQEILRWSSHPSDVWTLEDALRGTQIFGATGSGKTSGAGRSIARAFLKNGLGGLVLCITKDEAESWEKLCHQMGRSSDVRRIGINSGLHYNFLDEEAKFGKEALVLNVSELFSEIVSIVNRSQGNTKDSFWSDVLGRMLNHAIILELYANYKVSISGLMDLINGAVMAAETKGNRAVTNKIGVQEGYFRQICRKAKENREDDFEVDQAIQFFETEFASLAEKTRSIVVVSFTSMADALMRRPLRSLLCEETTCSPQEAFDGKILIVDVPIHEYEKIGRIMNLIWKISFKRACQRRRDPNRPVFIWEDESQYLLDSSTKFQTTARSLRCCTVCLTQNIPNYFAELGNKDAVRSFLGSLHNKIYHQNGDTETNQFASDAIGKVPIRVETRTRSRRRGFFSESDSGSTTQSVQWDYDVPIRVFTNLKSGGIRNRYTVEAVIHLPGRKFSSGKTWMKAEFRQDI